MGRNRLRKRSGCPSESPRSLPNEAGNPTAISGTDHLVTTVVLRHLQEFSESVGEELKVSDLCSFHVTKITSGRVQWSATTKHGFARAVQRALKWAEDQGLISATPLKKV